MACTKGIRQVTIVASRGKSSTHRHEHRHCPQVFGRVELGFGFAFCRVNLLLLMDMKNDGGDERRSLPEWLVAAAVETGESQLCVIWLGAVAVEDGGGDDKDTAEAGRL